MVRAVAVLEPIFLTCPAAGAAGQPHQPAGMFIGAPRFARIGEWPEPIAVAVPESMNFPVPSGGTASLHVGVRAAEMPASQGAGQVGREGAAGLHPPEVFMAERDERRRERVGRCSGGRVLGDVRECSGHDVPAEVGDIADRPGRDAGAVEDQRVVIVQGEVVLSNVPDGLTRTTRPSACSG
jgi:hypothetical protein